jgi:hypothetical protein
MYLVSHPASTPALKTIRIARASVRIAAKRANRSVHGLPGGLGRGGVLQLEQTVIQAAAGE